MYQPLTFLVAKILGLENQNLWHRLNLFAVKFVNHWKSKLTKELTLCHKLWFLIQISLDPNVVNLWYFKLIFFDLTKVTVWNFRFTRLESNDIGIRKSEFVAKSQFRYVFSNVFLFVYCMMLQQRLTKKQIGH